MVDAAVQEQPGDGVDRAVVAHGRARPGDAGQVDRRAGVHERQRHELGEPAGLVLQPGEQLQVRDPVVRLVDVAVHHRAGRRQAGAVRGLHDLDPLRRRQLALGEHPADVVVEDLGGRAGQAVDAGRAHLLQELRDADLHPGRPVDDLHRAVGVQVQPRGPALHGAGEVEVGGAGQLRVDAALHADLGGPDVPGLARPVGDLVEGERVGVGVGAALGEGAEPAAGVADVGEVDVPVDDVGDVVPDGVAADVVGQRADRVELGAVGGDERQGLRGGEVGRAVAGDPQGGRDVVVEPRGRGRLHLLPDGVPPAVDVVEVGAAVGGAAGGVDRGVQVGAAGAAQRVVGLLPRQAHGQHVRARGRPAPASAATCGARRGSSHGSSRYGGWAVSRSRRTKPASAVACAQRLDVRPGALGVDVVGGERADAAPVVDAGREQRRGLGEVDQVRAAPARASAGPSPAGSPRRRRGTPPCRRPGPRASRCRPWPGSSGRSPPARGRAGRGWPGWRRRSRRGRAGSRRCRPAGPW